MKTSFKKPTKSLHQQLLLVNHSDIISDDEDHIFTRIPKDTIPFTTDSTLTDKNVSTISKTKSDTFSTIAIEGQQPINLSTQ